MHHFKKKNSKIFFPEELHENVSPGPAVALDRPATTFAHITTPYTVGLTKVFQDFIVYNKNNIKLGLTTINVSLKLCNYGKLI